MKLEPNILYKDVFLSLFMRCGIYFALQAYFPYPSQEHDYGASSFWAFF
jgi:hypothetical protein